MAELSKTIDNIAGMAVYTVSGDVDNADEIINFIESHDNEKRMAKNLFDFTNASWSSIPIDEFKGAVKRARKFSRNGVETAFVLPEDVDFGIGRMLTALASAEGYVSTIRVFRTIETATEWLFGSKNGSDTKN